MTAYPAKRSERREKMADWILREDGALCLSGYPIRITVNRERGWFAVRSDFHGNRSGDWSSTLDGAKLIAAKLASEIDAFAPKESHPIILPTPAK